MKWSKPYLCILLLTLCACTTSEYSTWHGRQFERLAQGMPGYRLLNFREDKFFTIAVLGKPSETPARELSIRIYSKSSHRVETSGGDPVGARFTVNMEDLRSPLYQKLGGYDLCPVPPSCTIIPEGGQAGLDITGNSPTYGELRYQVRVSYVDGKAVATIRNVSLAP